jgi:Uma2 family endonuclease
MSNLPQLITAEELLLMRDHRHLELVDGVLHTTPLKGFAYGLVVSEVAAQLTKYVYDRRLGFVLANAGFVLARNPDTVLGADIAFVSLDRAKLHGIDESFFPEAPALVVEVIFPSDTAEEVDDKMRRWLAAGVELGWVVYPRGRTVTVYRALDDIRMLTANDMLDGDPVVPGFRCRVGDLFAGLDA